MARHSHTHAQGALGASLGAGFTRSGQAGRLAVGRRQDRGLRHPRASHAPAFFTCAGIRPRAFPPAAFADTCLRLHSPGISAVVHCFHGPPRAASFHLPLPTVGNGHATPSRRRTCARTRAAPRLGASNGDPGTERQACVRCTISQGLAIHTGRGAPRLSKELPGGQPRAARGWFEVQVWFLPARASPKVASSRYGAMEPRTFAYGGVHRRRPALTNDSTSLRNDA